MKLHTNSSSNMLNNPSSHLIHRYFHNTSLINVTFNITIHNSGNSQSLINHFSTALLSDPRQTDCPTTCYRSPAPLSWGELATTRDHQDNGIRYCGPQLQSYQPRVTKAHTYKHIKGPIITKCTHHLICTRSGRSLMFMLCSLHPVYLGCEYMSRIV